MSEQAPDDLVRRALSSAVTSYGISVLSNPQALGDLAAQLLPGMPRSRGLLTAAAEADVASLLRHYLIQQQADPAAAVRLVAHEMAERTALDPAWCEWITAEFARVLGYPPDAAARQRPQQPPVPQPAWRQQPGYRFPQPAAEQGGLLRPEYEFRQPAAEQPRYQQAAYGRQREGHQQAGNQRPGRHRTGYRQAGYQQSSGRPTQSRRGGGTGQGSRRWSWSRGRAAAVLIAAVVVLAAFAGLAAGVHLFPFAGSASPAPSGLTSHHPQAHPSGQPVPSAPPVSLASLDQVLPSVLGDPGSQCTSLGAPYHWKMSGVVGAEACAQVPGLRGGILYAYQLASAADYQNAWQNYNQWWGFDSADAGAFCPPPDASSEGIQDYSNDAYPRRSGQVLECEEVSGNQPAYSWTIPSENAFLVAQGAPGTTFAALNSWWASSASPSRSSSPAAESVP
jgi:hypothetical protein